MNIKPLISEYRTQNKIPYAVKPQFRGTSNTADVFVHKKKPLSINTFGIAALTFIALIKNYFIQLTDKTTKISDEELQEKIESGNGKISDSAFSPPDINDKIYENHTETIEHIANKMEKQSGVLKASDISDIAEKLSKKYKIPRQKVIDIMAKITQFGSYSQLHKMGEELSKQGISNIFTSSALEINTALNYINKSKKQFKLNYSPHWLSTYVLDDMSLKHLESLSENAKNNIKSLLDSNKLVFTTLDGCGIKVGENYYSYTALDGGLNLEGLTEAVILQKKAGKSDTEIYNNNYTERIKKLFGNDYAYKILNIKISEDKNTPETIAKQIHPNLPDSQTINTVIDVYLQENKFHNYTKEELKTLILKYLDYMVKIYSPDTIAKVLRQRHKEIETHLKNIGKSFDDVIYVIPEDNKSYDLINYMYAKINKVSPDKFKFADAKTKFPENSVIVIVDDIVGSGDSMTSDSFDYYAFAKYNPTSDVIFAPISTCKVGIDYIQKFMKDFRKNKKYNNDILLYDTVNTSHYKSFNQKYSEEIQWLLANTLGYMGHISNGLCTAFPYMIPDNCSTFSSYLLSYCLNTNNQYANKANPDYDLLEKMNEKNEKIHNN